ncbi:MAG: nucleoside triphosphate pyrophosphohydrolase [Clostridia bacterium]|nr:nucleoside triphosphate pyrophosphohydrolase [Clostridia bacterium]
MKTFNKLVRDKIPQKIENNGECCEIETLSDERFLEELNKKLQEEVKEYLESGEVEELADIAEVLRGILLAKKVDLKEFENLRQAKAEKRGGFEKKIFLKSTFTNEEKN